ncbi:MAG: hypothetical protein DBY35_03505 [Bacteroidales bacterium]|nr:MAG: hypothetical protein DBY35_03505 [Bacteroidales bacterium]
MLCNGCRSMLRYEECK